MRFFRYVFRGTSIRVLPRKRNRERTCLRTRLRVTGTSQYRYDTGHDTGMIRDETGKYEDDCIVEVIQLRYSG